MIQGVIDLVDLSRDGRTHRLPAMFHPENLAAILGPDKYEYILDRYILITHLSVLNFKIILSFYGTIPPYIRFHVNFFQITCVLNVRPPIVFNFFYLLVKGTVSPGF
jgi:hypothetical protein